MKKFLTVLVIAALVASSAFAGFSGNANVAFGYNFETEKYGFSNGTGFDFEVELNSASAEAIAEGDVYAGIKASMALKLANIKGDKAEGTEIWQDGGKDAGLGVFFEIAEAYVAGDGWKVIITGTQGAPDYAKSMLYTKKGDVKDIFGNKYDTKDVEDSYAVSAYKAPGVTVEVAGYKASVGLAGDTKVEKGVDFNAFIETPAFDFDGVTLQVAGIASRKVSDTDATKNFALGTGASAKVGFATDAVSGSVAADFGAKKAVGADDWTFGTDAVAKLAIAPVDLEVYYQNADFEGGKEKNILSAQVITDLNSFDVPVKLTVAGKNLVNKQDLSLKAEFAIDAFSITAKGGYVIADKKISAGAELKYTHDVFTAKAGVDFATVIDAKKNVLSASASVETEALIPGATLSLAYGSADEDMNFLADQETVQNFGKVEAKCTIKF